MQETKFQLVDIIAVNDKIMVREAFQSKKRGNLGISPNRGEGGSPKNQKSPKFQRASETEK